MLDTDSIHESVSCESEQLILVDADDREIGFRSKGDCHDAGGILHRAFSLFVFNPAGELLLQRRAAAKRLWPMFWSNSCCSHPRRGESMDQAVERRLYQELRMRSSLRYLFKFQYEANYGLAGSERELCWVYAGISHDPVQANRSEIAQWRFVRPESLSREINRNPAKFTPWLKIEWPLVQDHYFGRRSRFEHLLNQAAANSASPQGASRGAT